MEQKKKYKWLIIISIIIITLLHYFTILSAWGVHAFYRRLYYIPIILSSFKFGLKGGMASSLAVVVLYAPHLLMYFGKIDIEVLNQFLEIAMFMIIGTITGALVESESKTKRLLEIQIMKLTDLENYTKNILDSILNGVIAIDKNMRINSINREGKQVFHMEKHGEYHYIYDYFEESDKIKKIISIAMERGESIQGYETNSLKEHHGKTTVRIHGYPLKNIMNRRVGMVIIIEDITEVKKLENHIRRVDKLSAIGELASGIAHEIRNPLGIIKTISQTICRDMEDEEVVEGLEIIELEIDRANRVIQELLDFAKPSVFNQRFQSIDKVITELLRITNKYAEQNHVKIHYQCKNDGILFIDGDKLKQAFVNLILNDIQAMAHGGNLCITLEDHGKWMHIAFKDEGPGIDKEKLEKIFEPFYTTKEKGTGLGLAITHRIIEEHHGYLEVESEMNVGTTFHIYLPKIEEGGLGHGQKDIDR